MKPFVFISSNSVPVSRFSLKMHFVGVPTLVSQVGYALEGVVVLSGDIVHIVALEGSLSDVRSVELAVDGELHSMAVVCKGMAQYARLRLDGLHEGASIGGDDRDAAELRLNVDAADGFDVCFLVVFVDFCVSLETSVTFVATTDSSKCCANSMRWHRVGSNVFSRCFC